MRNLEREVSVPATTSGFSTGTRIYNRARGVPQVEDDTYRAPASVVPKTMGERVEHAIYRAGFMKGQVAEILGVTRQTIGRWSAGDEIPEQQLRRLCRLTGRSEQWMRYGELPTTEAYEEARRLGREEGIRQALGVLESMREEL